MAEKVPSTVKEAKGPLWKKVLWWMVGILGVIGAFVLILCLIRKKGPVTVASDIVKDIKYKVDKIDIEAKVKVAEAESIEKAVIDQIKAAAEIKDERKRLQALATALAEDY